MNKSNDHTSSNLGKWMVYAAWILFLGLLTVFFNNYLAKQNNPNTTVHGQTTPDQSIEVVLQRNRYGHYVANGEINGNPVTFLLDTGATTISIPKKTADRLHIKKGAPLSAHTANGTVTVYHTKLDSVAIGPIILHQLRGDINPNMGGEEILLGMNFLKQLELVQRGDRLILRQLSANISF